MADSIELDDSPFAAHDSVLVCTLGELRQAQVDEAAADLLDVPHTLGELQALFEGLDGIVDPTHCRVDVAEQTNGAAERAEVAVRATLEK